MILYNIVDLLCVIVGCKQLSERNIRLTESSLVQWFDFLLNNKKKNDRSMVRSEIPSEVQTLKTGKCDNPSFLAVSKRTRHRKQEGTNVVQYSIVDSVLCRLHTVRDCDCTAVIAIT